MSTASARCYEREECCSRTGRSQDEIGMRNVDAFWAWFAKNSVRLSNNLEDERTLRELDRRVSSLGPKGLSWEVGPGHERPFQLVISASGNKDLLKRTRAIISAAPNIPGWELHFAKPPKDWVVPRFSFRAATGQEIEINAEAWEYALLQFRDAFDILVRPMGCQNLSETDRSMAVEILLDGLLGEMERMRRIASIEVVTSFDEGVGENINKIGVLADHLRSLE